MSEEKNNPFSPTLIHQIKTSLCLADRGDKERFLGQMLTFSQGRDPYTVEELKAYELKFAVTIPPQLFFYLTTVSRIMMHAWGWDNLFFSLSYPPQTLSDPNLWIIAGVSTLYWMDIRTGQIYQSPSYWQSMDGTDSEEEAEDEDAPLQPEFNSLVEYYETYFSLNPLTPRSFTIISHGFGKTTTTTWEVDSAYNKHVKSVVVEENIAIAQSMIIENT